MPQQGKIATEEKERIVTGYLNGRIGYKEAQDLAGIGDATLRKWVSLYKTEGPKGLQPNEKKRIYPAELKASAVSDYLNGFGSLRDICEKYEIRSWEILRGWIKVYNRHKEIKSVKGGVRMTKPRKTTKEERLSIALECIASGNNYGEMTIKHNVSYQQVYTWVKKLQEQGDAALDDRRGHRPPPHEPLTEEERLRQENKQLKKANYLLQMELDYRKKLKEVEGRNR